MLCERGVAVSVGCIDAGVEEDGGLCEIEECPRVDFSHKSIGDCIDTRVRSADDGRVFERGD